MQEISASRKCPVVVVLIKLCWGRGRRCDVDIQPITRADFVPAKVFRSRSMNMRTEVVWTVQRRGLGLPDSGLFGDLAVDRQAYWVARAL